MRLATTLLVSALTALFLSVSSAHAHASTHRQNKHASRALAQRQHREPRALIDICVSLDANAFTNLGLGVPLELIARLNRLNLCLCLQDLDLFLDTNVELQLLVGLLGRTTVSSILRALINTAPGRQQCTYPLHSHRLCTTKNPCAYACDPLYMRVGDACVCAPPNTMCNGQCGPKSCGSAVPRSLKARSGGIVTLKQAQATCKRNENVCGIYGREPGSRHFECVDWDINLESCGGCLIQHSFIENNPATRPHGTDCSKLLGVLEVACVSGRCNVTRCKPDYKISVVRDSCILIDTGIDVVNANVSLGLGGFRMRRDKTPSTVVANADVQARSDLLPKLDDLVDKVVKIKGLRGLLRLSTPSDTHADTKSRLRIALDALVNATVAFVTSPNIASVNTLADATVPLKDEFLKCGCGDTLGLAALLQDTGDLVDLTSAIKDWFAGNPIGATGEPTHLTHLHSSTIALDTTALLTKLGLPGVRVGTGVGDAVADLSLDG